MTLIGILEATRMHPASTRVGLLTLLLGGALSACSPSTPAKGPVQSPAPAASSGQDQPAAYRGAAIAGQVCAQCHSVSTADTQGAVPGAPSFVSVANRQGTSADTLSRWLASSHPGMPNYMFTQQSADDLVAYIMTLRR